MSSLRIFCEISPCCWPWQRVPRSWEFWEESRSSRWNLQFPGRLSDSIVRPKFPRKFTCAVLRTIVVNESVLLLIRFKLKASEEVGVKSTMESMGVSGWETVAVLLWPKAVHIKLQLRDFDRIIFLYQLLCIKISKIICYESGKKSGFPAKISDSKFKLTGCLDGGCTSLEVLVSATESSALSSEEIQSITAEIFSVSSGHFDRETVGVHVSYRGRNDDLSDVRLQIFKIQI